MATYDLIIKNSLVVTHDQEKPLAVDIAIKDGKIAKLEANLDASQATESVDAGGKLAFPGVLVPSVLGSPAMFKLIPILALHSMMLRRISTLSASRNKNIPCVPLLLMFYINIVENLNLKQIIYK
jgi:hypothetical protein